MVTLFVSHKVWNLSLGSTDLDKLTQLGNQAIHQTILATSALSQGGGVSQSEGGGVLHTNDDADVTP